MRSHPLDLLRIVFVVLVLVMIIVGSTTKSRPQTQRDWTLVWAVLVFLAWALLGFGWVRACMRERLGPDPVRAESLHLARYAAACYHE